MVPNNTNNNNSVLLEVLASLFTVYAYFLDNPRIWYLAFNLTLSPCHFLTFFEKFMGSFAGILVL